MSEQGSEQNKSEDATPFKLKRAREKGQVARGIDLGFFAGLSAFALFALVAGPRFAGRLAVMTRTTIRSGLDHADDPQALLALIGQIYWPALQGVMLLGGTIVAVVTVLEIIQLRGIVFSGHPLKPDFGRLNPAKGLKRLFSMRMVKETLKNVLKMAVYSGCAFLAIRAALNLFTRASMDGTRLAGTMYGAGLRLVGIFLVLAFAFVVLDQIISRREFAKQMRMSHRELTRESKEREGEPRIKQKRKQLHAELVKQASGLGRLRGSDLVVVNPEHFAVALRYDRAAMAAPIISASGRNLFAQLIKRRAATLGLAVISDPPLARALYREGQPGAEIPADLYASVALHYRRLYQRRQNQDQEI